MKILIVDDDAIVRFLVGHAFNKKVKVLEACNSRDAMRQFLKTKFEVVLVDINLGHENGLELAADFRDLAPPVRLILLSADVNNMEKVRRAGFGDMLLKPFSIEELRSVFSGIPPLADKFSAAA